MSACGSKPNLTQTTGLQKDVIIETSTRTSPLPSPCTTSEEGKPACVAHTHAHAHTHTTSIHRPDRRPYLLGRGGGGIKQSRLCEHPGFNIQCHGSTG